MAGENVQNFLSRVREDQELQKQLRQIGETYQGESRNLKVIIANNILPTARKLGYDFSIEEYVSYINQYSRKRIETFGQLEGMGLSVLFPGSDLS